MLAALLPAVAPARSGFSLAAFMAQQADGFWYDFTRIASLSQDTAGATPVAAPNDVIGRVVDQRTGPNSPRNATQASASLKPKYQTTGALFDGLDDNLLSTYLAAAGPGFVMAKAILPASVPASQVIVGAEKPSGTRLIMVTRTSGQLDMVAGGFSGSGIGPDLRGQEATVCIATNGSQVRLIVNGAVLRDDALSGSAVPANALRIGALNSVTDTATAPFGGTIKSIIAGREFIDLARFNQIAPQL